MKSLKFGKIEKTIKNRCKNILESLELFDVYRSEKLGIDKKSVAYALKFRSSNKTLTDYEINEIMNIIILNLKKEFGAELRK